MLNIGKKMSDIKIPQVELKGYSDDEEQVEPSSIFSYLDIRGLGRDKGSDKNKIIKRKFNAIPYLNYFDIYKNYYANKQEEIGYIIHNNADVINNNIIDFTIWDKIGGQDYLIDSIDNTQQISLNKSAYAYIQFASWNPDDRPDLDLIYLDINGEIKGLGQVFTNYRWERPDIVTGKQIGRAHV